MTCDQDAFGYSYNGSNQLESVTDGNNHSRSWLYDALGRATQKTYANGSYEKYFYDSLGQVISQRMANGTIVNFTYDNRGNVTLIDYPNMADVSYTYNNLNQVATMTDGIGTTTYGYDTMGRLTSVDGPWSNDTITYTYDALGRRSQVSLNGNATDYDYDSLSRLSEVTNNSHVFDYSYNGASDQLDTVTLPNGTESTFTYDSLGRLNNVQDKVVSGGANISQFTYGYDNRDVQTSVERALGTAASQTVNYTYDDINQLTGETSTETTPLVNNSYTYDDAGNRLTSSIDGTSSSFTLDEMNQISGYTLGGNAMNVQYDANGNTTQLGFQVMTYDDADRLTSVIQKNPLTGDNVKKVEYEYDGLSRRSTSTTYTWNAGNETWDQQSERRFIYDGMDLIEERDGSNNVIASYVRDGNIGGVLSRTTSNGTFYYHYDGNGNVVAMTNGSGAIVAEYTYDAYGNLTAMSGSQAADNPIRFSTKYFDSKTGYYDFGFRSYDPVTGRWLNRDPIGESGGLNLYGFVGNSPGNAVDGYGLDALITYGSDRHSNNAFFKGIANYYADIYNRKMRAAHKPDRAHVEFINSPASLRKAFAKYNNLDMYLHFGHGGNSVLWTSSKKNITPTDIVSLPTSSFRPHPTVGIYTCHSAEHADGQASIAQAFSFLFDTPVTGWLGGLSFINNVPRQSKIDDQDPTGFNVGFVLGAVQVKRNGGFTVDNVSIWDR